MITDKPSNRKTTIVIPAYNEAPVIVQTLTLLCDAFGRAPDVDWEIIVADNGSTDGTGDAVTGMGNKRIRLLRLEEKGKGHALRAAFAKAEGEIVGFTDADLPILPEEIIAAVKVLATRDVDLVIGSRLLSGSKTPGREWWRTGSSLMFNFFARAIVGITASDTQCPLKLMNTKGLELMFATKESSWFLDLEFLALAERIPLRITEIPLTWNEHRYPKRKSKLTAMDSVRAIGAMFRIRRRLPAQLMRLRSQQRMI